MSDIRDAIRKYLEPTLGRAKSSYGQLKFDCPKPTCASGKYNLEVCTRENNKYFLSFNCWSCSYKGHVTKLLREYADGDDWKKLPEFKKQFSPVLINEVAEEEIVLPKGIVPYYHIKSVADYLLNERKMSKQFLKVRKVKYVFDEKEELYGKIIFPFYKDKQLIAFTAQDFATKKYKNFGAMNFVAYEEFSNPFYPVVITEGIYDAGSVINAIPLMGTRVNHDVFKFVQGKKIILSLDNEVPEETQLMIAQKMLTYGAKKVALFDLEGHKDLNEMFIKDEEKLKEQLLTLYKTL